MFKSLRICDFERHEHLNLSALRALPSLEELYLTAGEYNNVPSAGRLTKLFAHDADVNFTTASMEDISFSCLRLFNSSLIGLHDSGLTACKALVDLEIATADVLAAHGYGELSVGEHVDEASVPAKMSELTCLTKLDMVLACRSANRFDLDRVYSVVSLRHLELEVQGSFKVSEQLTRLVKLTSLTLNCADICQAAYSVDRKELQALKHLELAGQISFDSRMLQLTSIQSLVCIKVTGLHPCATDGTSSELARLMYQLAAQCPQVQVHVDGKLIGSSAF